MKYLVLLLVFSSTFSLNLRQTLSAESQNELKISEFEYTKLYDMIYTESDFESEAK